MSISTQEHKPPLTGITGISFSSFRILDVGGGRRDRTDDLMLAKHALYQLSYGPLKDRQALQSLSPIRLPKAPRSRWWAQADSNCRPHAYQACALTN